RIYLDKVNFLRYNNNKRWKYGYERVSTST
ncbi:unnamed protein product, partial [marine sediment metagenome]